MTAPIDHHLEALGIYLQERLNEAGSALDTPMEIVKGLTYLVDMNSIDLIPLLQIYRLSGKGVGGDRVENWQILYRVSSYSDPYDTPRVLAWLFEDYNESNIINLLRNYFSTSDRCGKLDEQSLVWEYSYSVGASLKFSVIQ